jgi:hypothetical protein
LALKQFYIKNVGPAKIQRVQQKIPGCWTYVQQNENKFQKVWGGYYRKHPFKNNTNVGLRSRTLSVFNFISTGRGIKI